MAEASLIEWTENTFNTHWGCHKVSPGCKFCYAEGTSSRHTKRLFNEPVIWGRTNPRGFFENDSHWNEPLKWNRRAKKSGIRERVFSNSMSDLFEWHPDEEVQAKLNQARHRLFAMIEKTDHLIWLLLTKRPENIKTLCPERWLQGFPTNVCMMTSVENQEQAEKRIPILEDVPAFYRGLSVEPLIERVNLVRLLTKIDWVIVGGESGPGERRKMSPLWVDNIRVDCWHNNVSFMFKQWGNYIYRPDLTSSYGWPSAQVMNEFSQIPWKYWEEEDFYYLKVGKKKAGRLLDGLTYDDHPFQLVDLKDNDLPF